MLCRCIVELAEMAKLGSYTKVEQTLVLKQITWVHAEKLFAYKHVFQHYTNYIRYTHITIKQ